MKQVGLARLITLGGAGFALLVCALAFGFQDNLFRYAMDPRRPFQTTPPPPAPDFADDSAWALRGAATDPAQPAIFFIHPTTYWGGSAWNADVSPGADGTPRERRLRDEAIPNHAGPFVQAGEVWAPRYRQSSLYAALTHRYDARRARALAYSDVQRAFERFVTEAPAEAPLVIVGVEQGGLHALGVLQHALRNERVRERLAAAYVIDQATPLDLFDGPLRHMRPCEAETDVRCVVSWGAVRADDNEEIRRFRRRSMTWTTGGRLEPTANRALLCVNPVFGAQTEDFAPARLHQGGVNATDMGVGVTPAPLRAQTSAQCRDGVLLVDEPESRALRTSWSWGGVFKPSPVNLFYADVEADLTRRLTAFAAQRATEARAAPPLDGVIRLSDSPIHKVPED